MAPRPANVRARGPAAREAWPTPARPPRPVAADTIRSLPLFDEIERREAERIAGFRASTWPSRASRSCAATSSSATTT